MSATGYTSVPRPDVSSRVGSCTWQHHPGMHAKEMSPHTDARKPQNNILITQGGQACLGDLGIATAFGNLDFYAYELGNLRYMAPECFLWEPLGCSKISGPTEESDIYSLVMTSFFVRSSVVNHPTTYYDLPAIIRFSRGCCHTIIVTATRLVGPFKAARGHPAQ